MGNSETEIAVLKTDLTYIKEKLDEIHDQTQRTNGKLVDHENRIKQVESWIHKADQKNIVKGSRAFEIKLMLYGCGVAFVTGMIMLFAEKII